MIIVIAMHNLAAAERLCDEVIVLNKGRCVVAGKCDTVLSAERLEEVFGVTKRRIT